MWVSVVVYGATSPVFFIPSNSDSAKKDQHVIDILHTLWFTLLDGRDSQAGENAAREDVSMKTVQHKDTKADTEKATKADTEKAMEVTDSAARGTSEEASLERKNAAALADLRQRKCLPVLLTNHMLLTVTQLVHATWCVARCFSAKVMSRTFK